VSVAPQAPRGAAAPLPRLPRAPPHGPPPPNTERQSSQCRGLSSMLLMACKNKIKINTHSYTTSASGLASM
jgi:hypothetical protein